VAEPTERVLAWHFLAADRRLSNGDGRLVVPGETLSVNGHVGPWYWGLHGCESPVSALDCVWGPICERTEHSGEIKRKKDVLCSTERRCLWLVDARQAAMLFLASRAASALQRAGVTDPRCWMAVHVCREVAAGRIAAGSPDVMAVASAAAQAGRTADPDDVTECEAARVAACYAAYAAQVTDPVYNGCYGNVNAGARAARAARAYAAGSSNAVRSAAYDVELALQDKILTALLNAAHEGRLPRRSP
jgi:hypothetical protein